MPAFTHHPSELANAMRNRAAMLSEGVLSRPQSERRMAVVTSLAINRLEVPEPDAQILLTEREAILQTCQQEGVAIDDVTRPSIGDMVRILTDETITDICLIGEGSVGCMYLLDDKHDPLSGTAFDWRAVARSADHLKTGHVYQRMCSGIGFAAIAWGTFAVADLRNVWISNEESFVPEQHERPEQGLGPAYDDEILSHDTLGGLKARLLDRRAEWFARAEIEPVA